MWLLFQYSASKCHLLIKKIKESVAIVSEQLINCIYIHLLNQKIRKGVAIASVQCIYTHLLIKQIRRAWLLFQYIASNSTY